MAKFSKEILNFLKEANNNDSLGPSQQDKITIPTAVSANQISPGDLLIFNYLNKQRVAMAVKTKRTGSNSAVYFHWSEKNKSGNNLLTCFKLNESPGSIISMVMENLYKKKAVASYVSKEQAMGSEALPSTGQGFNKKQVAGLKAILGSSTFRTFKLNIQIILLL